MENNRRIIQLVLETRHILAHIGEEDGKSVIQIPVFAWLVYDDEHIEPLFIDESYLANASPYGLDWVRRVSKNKLGILDYEWKNEG